jgi:hypothetical protein
LNDKIKDLLKQTSNIQSSTQSDTQYVGSLHVIKQIKPIKSIESIEPVVEVIDQAELVEEKVSVKSQVIGKVVEQAPKLYNLLFNKLFCRK